MDNFEPRSDFHNTLLFAVTFDPTKTPKLCDQLLEARPLRVDQFGNAVVIILRDDENIFISRHNQLKEELNATHQHPTYVPHITIGYKKTTLTKDESQLIQNSFDNVVFRFSEEKWKLFKTNQ